MPKTSKPAIEKLKENILNDLTPEDQVELGDWFQNVLDVREADAMRARRKEATKQTLVSPAQGLAPGVTL